MPQITPEIKNLLNRLKLGYVATVSSDNGPNVSPKGTIMAWNDHLVFADIKSPQTMINLKNNPAVEINVVDPLIRKGFRFKGSAIILKEGPEFSEIINYYKENGIKSKINAIVKVKIETLREITSPLYDLGLHENEIKEKWKKIYSKF